MFKKLQILLIVSTILLVGACATSTSYQTRQVIKVAPENDIQLAEVRVSPETYIGTMVRWGGKVLKSEKIKTDEGKLLIRIEVLQRDLDKNARPGGSGDSDGRFVAYIEQTEKKIHSLKHDYVTIIGKITKTETMQLNEENSVVMPVLAPENYYVWHSSDYRWHSSYYDDHFYGPRIYVDYYGFPYYRLGYKRAHRWHIHNNRCAH